jgi:hypothetical protein
MIIQRVALDSLLLKNVCEIRFVRRRPRAGDGPTRRMLCTKSYELLNSVNGRTTLNYAPPRGPKKINEAAENVLVVWDILMQDYRTINMNSCDLIQQIPDNEFWEYFNENIYPMSPEQKFNFMNS